VFGGTARETAIFAPSVRTSDVREITRNGNRQPPLHSCAARRMTHMRREHLNYTPSLSKMQALFFIFSKYIFVKKPFSRC
jgi:hypothetical protein